MGSTPSSTAAGTARLTRIIGENIFEITVKEVHHNTFWTSTVPTGQYTDDTRYDIHQALALWMLIMELQIQNLNISDRREILERWYNHPNRYVQFVVAYLMIPDSFTPSFYQKYGVWLTPEMSECETWLSIVGTNPEILATAQALTGHDFLTTFEDVQQAAQPEKHNEPPPVVITEIAAFTAMERIALSITFFLCFVFVPLGMGAMGILLGGYVLGDALSAVIAPGLVWLAWYAFNGVVGDMYAQRSRTVALCSTVSVFALAGLYIIGSQTRLSVDVIIALVTGIMLNLDRILPLFKRDTLLSHPAIVNAQIIILCVLPVYLVIILIRLLAQPSSGPVGDEWGWSIGINAITTILWITGSYSYEDMYRIITNKRT